jgi:membrane fusion protein (multidrug efflux system)
MQDTPHRAPRERLEKAFVDDGRSSGDATEHEARRSGLLTALRSHPYVAGAALVVVIASLAGAGLWWLNARHFEWTDDAFIDARQFAVSSKVPGYITEVPVTDNQEVEAGELIAQIDRRDFEVALRQAQAQLEQAQASVQSSQAQIAAQDAQVAAAQEQLRQAEAASTFASQENDRAQSLLKDGNGTLQRAQQTKSQLEQAQATVNAARSSANAALKQVASLKAQEASAVANVAAASAQKAQAELNLGYTSVAATQKGRVVHLTAAKGQYVQVGQNLSMFVPYPVWVTANFKETQISDIRPGQSVSIEVDAYPRRELHGHVDSIQSGSGTAFSLLPAENATGNFVKIVQRVPVKIVIDDVPADIPLGPGMSVVPSVRVR